MPPARSEASVAAAPATTRSGRVKQVSTAALLSVANENREAQQARRSRKGGKSVRRNGTSTQGQAIATGTPAVVITSQSALQPSQRRRVRSPLGSGDTSPPQPSATPQSSLALPRYSATQTPATLARLTSQDQSATAPAMPNISTTTSRQRPLRNLGTSVLTNVTSMGGDPEEGMSEDGEPEDRERAGGGGGWREDHVDDGDEGASDGYVPSEVGKENGDEEESDRMELDSRDGDAVETGEPEGDEDGGDEGDRTSTKKKRAPRHSQKARRTAPKASDYSPEVEGLLSHAAGFMRALIVAENPMPSVDDSITLAADAFEMAKYDRPHIEIPEEIAYISILRRCIPQVRGKVKDAARAKVGDAYGFDDRPSMQQKNRRLYLALLDQDSYVYEKPDAFEGPYYNSLCFKTLKACFFGKPTDDGVAFSEWFSPIHMETIALVFAAIRMCLDEWKSGSYKPLMFTSDVYEPVYQVHLANLKALDEQDPHFVKGLGEELWEDCSEPFDLENTHKPTSSITITHKLNGVAYGQERRNARAARKAAVVPAA